MERSQTDIPKHFSDRLMTMDRLAAYDERSFPEKWTKETIRASWDKVMAQLGAAINEIMCHQFDKKTPHHTFSTHLDYTDHVLFRELVLDTRLWADVQKTLLLPLYAYYDMAVPDDTDKNRLRIFRYPIEASSMDNSGVQWFPDGPNPPKGRFSVNTDVLATIVIAPAKFPIYATRRFFLFRPKSYIPDHVMRRFQIKYSQRYSIVTFSDEAVSYALKSFLTIAKRYPDETAMKGIMDDLWHEMILDEIGYVAYCHEVVGCEIGTIINHTPGTSSSRYYDDQKYEQTYDRLRAIYKVDGETFPSGTLWRSIEENVSARKYGPSSLSNRFAAHLRRTQAKPQPQRSSSTSSRSRTTTSSVRSSYSSSSDAGNDAATFMALGSVAGMAASDCSGGSDYSGGGDCGGGGGGDSCGGGDSGGGDCGGGGSC